MKRALPLVLMAACVPPLDTPPEPDTTALSSGETRSVVLRHLALEVEGFEEVVDLARLQRLPPAVLDQIWLLDVPLEGLVRNSLDKLASLTVQQARQLPVPAQNMRLLLRSTADNILLEGTALEEMVSLSAALAIPPGRALSEILDVGLLDPVIPRDLATDVLVEQLIATHPATQSRAGPVNEAHPDGLYDVAPNSLPITMGDIVSSFGNLAERFGPIDTPLGPHPGFISEADGVAVTQDDFQMVVKVNANALPYRGLDLTNATDASVNSTGSQIEGLFDTSDPDWLTIQGLVPEPSISTLTVLINEDAAFHTGGLTREPLPQGASTAWDLAPWVFERLIIEMSARASARVSDHCVSYSLGTGVQAFEACVDGTGWATFETFNGIGNPPAPAYLWDLVVELAQVRLHDGGLPEGGADVAFSLSDVSLGVDAEAITAEARANVAANTTVLKELAQVLTENSRGAADFFYVRGDEAGPEAEQGDWLYFVLEDDLPIGDDGQRTRAYTYAQPGFFADEALTTKVSAPTFAHGESAHDKVPVSPGDTLYLQDDEGAVFRLDVTGKPSRARIAVDVTRVR